MAQVKYSLKQLMHLVEEGVAKNGSSAYQPEDRKSIIGDDPDWKVIGYSESKFGSKFSTTGILYKSVPSNILFVVTGQAMYNW